MHLETPGLACCVREELKLQMRSAPQICQNAAKSCRQLHYGGPQFVKAVNHGARADRSDGPPSARGAAADAAGAGCAAGHLGQLPEPDRARPADSDGVAADQAWRNA